MNVGYPNGWHNLNTLRAIEAMMAERPDNAGWSRCEGMGGCGFGRQAVCEILARADRWSPGRLTGQGSVKFKASSNAKLAKLPEIIIQLPTI